MTDAVIERKVATLVAYLATLDVTVRGVSSETFLAWEPLRRYGVRYLLQVIVQGVVDLCQHRLASGGHEPAEDYFQAVVRAGERGIIPADLAHDLAPATGLRNALVHEYADVDDRVVYDSVAKALALVPRFVATIRTSPGEA